MNSYKNIFKKAENPRYISGIYNYCDRWCERCAFTSRCLTYAIEKEDAEDSAVRDINNKAFWDRLQAIFEQTREMIIELARGKGIDIDALDMKSASDDFSHAFDEVKNHELALAARYYSEMVERWFEAEYPMFEKRQDELNTMLRIDVGGDEPHAEASDINDAVDVIRWYQHGIYVKLLRALTQNESVEIEQGAALLQNDSNGSALVALLAIDRSIGAWGRFQKYFPEKTDSILDILLHLDRLRRKVEQGFPDARKFKRPGFDDLNYRT